MRSLESKQFLSEIVIVILNIHTNHSSVNIKAFLLKLSETDFEEQHHYANEWKIAVASYLITKEEEGPVPKYIAFDHFTFTHFRYKI